MTAALAQRDERGQPPATARLREMLRPRSETVSGSVQPIANRYSYFLRRERELERWDFALGAFVFISPPDHAACAVAAQRLVAHHDGLRLQGRREGGAWREEIVPPETTEPLRQVRYAGPAPRDALSGALAEVRQESRFPGPLFRVLLVDCAGQSFLAFHCHHLAVDMLSAGLIVEDFLHFYRDTLSPGVAELPRPSTAFRDYCHGSIAYWLARQHRDAPYWTSLPWRDVEPLRPPPELDANTERYTRHIVRDTGLSSDAIARLPQATGWNAAEILLAAIARAYADWSGKDILHLAFVVPGRESFLAEVNLSRTVGWISETIPLLLNGRGPQVELLAETRSQLRTASAKGKGYGIARHCLPGGDAFADHPEPDVSLNMKLRPRDWRLDGDLIAFDKSNAIPPPCSETAQRVFMLSGGVFFDDANRLILSWDFSARVLGQECVDTFSSSCVETIGRFTETLMQKSGAAP